MYVFKLSSLLSIPDISKWDLKLVIEKMDMFKGCNNSLIIPKFKNQS